MVVGAAAASERPYVIQRFRRSLPLHAMIAIEDTNHCESRGEYETLDEAIAELRYLSSVPWDHLPNRCPCSMWRKCERIYELREIDETSNKIVRRLVALRVSRHGAKWISDLEERWRSASREPVVRPAPSARDVMPHERPLTLIRSEVVDRQTASSFPQGALELRGDYGGHTWIISEASHVKASDGALEQLAVDLGARFTWSVPEANWVSWTITNYWDEWRTGLKGDEFHWGLWINPLLLQRGVTREAVEAVLFGRSERLACPE